MHIGSNTIVHILLWNQPMQRNTDMHRRQLGHLRRRNLLLRSRAMRGN